MTHLLAAIALSLASGAEVAPPTPAPMQAQRFPLSAVRLLDSPFKTAQDADAKYLLTLNPDRLLHRFRKFAGMEPKAEEYGGWEKDTISGHTLGHYLSACAMMYASTGNPAFKEKVDYIVDELAAIQAHTGTGYVAGIPDHERLWAEIERGEIHSRGFDLNGLWVPWYNIHKTLAGLLDAQAMAGNDKALDVAKKLSDWTIHVTRNLDDAKWQQMLACEHGGMNESLAEVFARTKDPKYLEIARKFYHKAILDPLAEGKDILPGKHGNTQIPKIIGMARLYELGGETKDREISDFFWKTVVHHHAYAIGGITSGEYFGPPDKLDDRLTGSNCETCKTYNMLKLTWHRFGWEPRSDLADYAERSLYNHILASQNPKDGMMCYFVPLMPGSKKSFSDETHTFTCCVGSGMENHAKYGEGIYFYSNDTLWVNLYIPSELDWPTQKTKIRLVGTDFAPKLVISDTDGRELTLKFRRPGWAEKGATIKVNGKASDATVDNAGYWSIQRKWAKGDSVELSFPDVIRAESILGKPDRIALFRGPWVLAADLEAGGEKWVPGRMPVLVGKDLQPDQLVQPTASGTLRSVRTGRPHDFTLKPFYQIVDQAYSVYFDLFTAPEWVKEEERYRAEEAALLALDRRTIDYFAIGEMQPERDHKLEGEKTFAGDFAGKHWRDARDGGWFEFEMKVDPSANLELIFTYWGGDAGRTFDILVDGVKFMTQRSQNGSPPKFYDVAKPLPAELIKGKSTIKVRFQAPARGVAGGLFGCRVARIEARRE